MTMSTTETAAHMAFLAGLPQQRVLVTAGGAGIGLSIATLLRDLGARVAICDISQEAIASAGSKLDGILTLVTDVSDDQSVAKLFGKLAEAWNGLDALINNAGIAGPTGGIEDISSADWRRCIDICLTGQFLCARSAVPMLKAAGKGSIVNMSSAAGRHGYAFRTPYAAAKFGVIGLTESLAKELGPSGIRVNAILPGIVEGPRMDSVITNRAAQLGISKTEMESRYLEKVSLRRMVKPDDVARMVAFLLSDAGANISGQSLGVDGNVETL